MSQCYHYRDEWKITLKKFSYGILIIFLIVVVIILVLWAVYTPTKPMFVLQDATIHTFNLTSPAQLTSMIQVTIQAKNRNDKMGIYYDRMITYATYRDQQISLQANIPPTYQESNSMNLLWSPFLQGESIPVAPFIGAEINQEIQMGSVNLVIKMNGRVRWKVGSFNRKTDFIHVNCPALLPLGNPNTGITVSTNAVKYQLTQGCSVSG